MLDKHLDISVSTVETIFSNGIHLFSHLQNKNWLQLDSLEMQFNNIKVISCIQTFKILYVLLIFTEVLFYDGWCYSILWVLFELSLLCSKSVHSNIFFAIFLHHFYVAVPTQTLCVYCWLLYINYLHSYTYLFSNHLILCAVM